MTYPGGRHVEYGYDAVGNQRQLVDTSRGPVTRWAASAAASSQYWLGSVGEAAGAPNITGCAQATRTAQWLSGFDSWTTSREEWLELDYAKAERARGVRIHETYGGGFVMRVDLVEEDGTAHTVYEGGDRTACGEWLEVKFPLTSYQVKKVKVVTRALGPEGIDAVGLEAQVVEDYEYNGFNQLLSVTPSDGGAATTFGYDGNGNQISKTDASGVTQYVYGADDRLVGVALPGGGGSAYEYDANGLRVKKADSSGTTRYLLDGLSVIGQYGADGTRQAFYVQSLARIDEVLSVVNGQGKHWYQADALGSIYTLTTASGEVRARGGYDVFGAPVAESGAAVGQPFGFTGREHELDSGLVYARARYLNPGTGRWDRSDPFEDALDSDGVNLYAYAKNAPTNRLDPSGQVSVPEAPPGVLIDENILIADFQRMRMHWVPARLHWFYEAVRSRGPWDYKRRGKQYENFGNFNYGATGAALQFSEGLLLRGAGYASTQADPSRTDFWGHWWGDGPYGDDPRDQEQIKNGIEYYRENASRILGGLYCQ